MFRLNSSGVNLVPILIWYQYPNQYWYQYRYWYRCQFQVTRDDALTDSKSGKKYFRFGWNLGRIIFPDRNFSFFEINRNLLNTPDSFPVERVLVRSDSLTLSSCVSVTRDAASRGGDAMEGLPEVWGSPSQSFLLALWISLMTLNSPAISMKITH